MLTQLAPGLSQDGSTGLFHDVKIYIVNIGGERQIRYKTAYELGYIVGFNGLNFDNPYDPINLEEEEFYEGLAAGEDAKEKAAMNSKN